MAAAPLLDFGYEFTPESDFLLVKIVPDASMISPGGSVLMVDAAVTVSSSGGPNVDIAGASVDRAVWIDEVASENPFLGAETTGLWIGDPDLFAAFSSAPITTGEAIELLRIPLRTAGFTHVIDITVNLSQDGVVYPEVSTTYGIEAYVPGDYDNDYDVDDDDFGVFAGNFGFDPFGTAAAVPEPASAVVLLAGLVCAAGSRRVSRSP